MSSYSNVMSGGLKLKGVPKLKKNKKAKKKMKKKKRQREGGNGREGHSKIPRSLVSDGSKDKTHIIDTDDNNMNDKNVSEGTKIESNKVEEEDYRTDAEKAFDKKWEERKTERIKKFVSKTHREKISEFNKYLADLTEHHDIPKVANAGLG